MTNQEIRELPYWVKQRKDKEWRKRLIAGSIFKNAVSIEALQNKIAQFHKEYPNYKIRLTDPAKQNIKVLL